MYDTNSSRDPENVPSANPCMRSYAGPLVTVYRVDDSTFILRQDKCTNYEGPFMYVLIGSERVLLLDSGATAQESVFPIRAIVDQLLANHGKSNLLFL